MEPIKPEEIERLKKVRFNPLADYKLQTANKKRIKGNSLGQTSLRDDPRVNLEGFDKNKLFYYKEDVGNFDYWKVIENKGIRSMMFSLSSSTLKLFLWILFHLDYRSDVVKIDQEKMAKAGFEMSPGTLRDSVKELIQSEVILRVFKRNQQSEVDYDYWLFFINPQIIWKGDAKKFYKNLLSVHPEYNKDASGKIDA